MTCSKLSTDWTKDLRKFISAFAVLTTISTAPAQACGLELVLAMDVSRSVTNDEYELQLGGLVQAFRHPEVVEAIRWTPGGIMVSVTEWSGADAQAQTIGWRALSAPESVAAFASELAASRRQFFGAYTAIGEALVHANAVAAQNPETCTRRVIDVSGDGQSNRGRDPAPIAKTLAAQGVTVNALAIRGAKPDPAEYYAQQVIAGPGAFVEVADGFDDYAPAILRKLLREITPQVSQK